MNNRIVPAQFLSKEECKVLFDKIIRMTSGGGDTSVSVVSQDSGFVKWARNRVHISSAMRDVDVSISRSINGATASSNTSRLDDEGLLYTVREAGASMQMNMESPENIDDPFINEPILNPVLWSEGTYSFGADQRTDLVQKLIEGAEEFGMLSAGTLLIAANGTATMNTDGMFRYYPQTVVECSMTVRHPKGIASGWAGVNHYDLARIDPRELATQALDKCIHSANPVAVEPGRYTVILEPQATADLFRPIIDRAMDRQTAELPSGPFGKAKGRSKINDQVLDRRLKLSADPMDPEGGFLPYERYSGTPHRSVNWIEQGILKELSYVKGYALSHLGFDKALPNSRSFCLSVTPGIPTSTVEEMIQKTERGLLITRFSNVRLIDFDSMLCSGYTRDGIWLIERGKITKPVKNFRFTEPPLFSLNSLEDVGETQRVFAPRYALLAPSVRVRDFSLTSLSDAV